ncbi:unnamed protein product [Mytilus coruscus]|uniref:Uncharacterized protein n=1 Tax=Mytilus coruscus TaxID=42192 RepID=A0A6J8CFZ6_MYTCO|nr:unnamed protein product [Mytilus coruscus]
MTTPKDGKQIANMLYHAGVETMLTVGYAEIGSNYLFSHMGSNANEEKKRHDKAIEKLEKAQADWNKRRIQRLDFINEQLQKEHHAEHTFEDVDQAMKQYYYITSKQLTPLSPKPKLSDFYTPSEDQKIEKLHLLNMKDDKLVREMEDALNFKGFPKKIGQVEEVEIEIVDKNKNTHILLFGGSETGKTYFIKQYLKKNNITNTKFFLKMMMNGQKKL